MIKDKMIETKDYLKFVISMEQEHFMQMFLCQIGSLKEEPDLNTLKKCLLDAFDLFLEKARKDEEINKLLKEHENV